MLNWTTPLGRFFLFFFLFVCFLWLWNCIENALQAVLEGHLELWWCLMNLSLFAEHGDIEQSEVEEKQWTLKSRIIKVNLVSPNCPDRPPLLKSVPSDMSVQKLVGLTQKLFQTEGCIPRLYAISQKVSDFIFRSEITESRNPRMATMTRQYGGHWCGVQGLIA